MTRPDLLRAIVIRVDAHFTANGFHPLDQEQLGCLEDPYRTEEAFAMVNDWSSRLGLPDDIYDALNAWIEENEGVSDDSRSNGPRR
jgi:hypothetical protein